MQVLTLYLNWRIALPFIRLSLVPLPISGDFCVPMVTPALIVGAALQLSAETTAYLVSMAMIASGIGTWLQVNRYGIVGSGLL